MVLKNVYNVTFVLNHVHILNWVVLVPNSLLCFWPDADQLNIYITLLASANLQFPHVTPQDMEFTRV
jgi:hypothetical protein